MKCRGATLIAIVVTETLYVDSFRFAKKGSVVTCRSRRCAMSCGTRPQRQH